MARDRGEASAQARGLSRREMLGLLGVTATAALFGCSGEGSGAAEQTVTSPPPGCVVSPQQTEGPFFVNARLNRSDIRPDPVDGSTKPGVPLRLLLTVRQVSGRACAPLSGATVDLWQCDALGAYSDGRGQQFLRGYQVTDADGRVEFLTIYPGWYGGRAVHLHVKIRTGPTSDLGYGLTSQLYFAESLTNQVHAQAPYAARGRRDTTNSDDGIFRRGGDRLLLRLTPGAQGYQGTFDFGLQIA